MPIKSDSDVAVLLDCIFVNSMADLRRVIMNMQDMDACINTQDDPTETEQTAHSILAEDDTNCGNRSCKPNYAFGQIVPTLNKDKEVSDKTNYPFPYPSRDVVYTDQTKLGAEILFDLDKDVQRKIIVTINFLLKQYQSGGELDKNLKKALQTQSQCELQNQRFDSLEEMDLIEGFWGPKKLIAYGLHYLLRPLLNIILYAITHFNPIELNLFITIDSKELIKEFPGNMKNEEINCFITTVLNATATLLEMDRQFFLEISTQIFQYVLLIIKEMPRVFMIYEQHFITHNIPYNSFFGTCKQAYTQLLYQSSSIFGSLIDEVFITTTDHDSEQSDVILDQISALSTEQEQQDKDIGKLPPTEVKQKLLKDIHEKYQKQTKKSILEAILEAFLYDVTGDGVYVQNFQNTILQSNYNNCYYLIEHFVASFHPYKQRSIYIISDYIDILFNSLMLQEATSEQIKIIGQETNTKTTKILSGVRSKIIALLKKHEYPKFLLNLVVQYKQSIEQTCIINKDDKYIEQMRNKVHCSVLEGILENIGGDGFAEFKKTEQFKELLEELANVYQMDFSTNMLFQQQIQLLGKITNITKSLLSICNIADRGAIEIKELLQTLKIDKNDVLTLQQSANQYIDSLEINTIQQYYCNINSQVVTQQHKLLDQLSLTLTSCKSKVKPQKIIKNIDSKYLIFGEKDQTNLDEQQILSKIKEKEENFKRFTQLNYSTKFLIVFQLQKNNVQYKACAAWPCLVIEKDLVLIINENNKQFLNYNDDSYYFCCPDSKTCFQSLQSGKLQCKMQGDSQCSNCQSFTKDDQNETHFLCSLDFDKLLYDSVCCAKQLENNQFFSKYYINQNRFCKFLQNEQIAVLKYDNILNQLIMNTPSAQSILSSSAPENFEKCTLLNGRFLVKSRNSVDQLQEQILKSGKITTSVITKIVDVFIEKETVIQQQKPKVFVLPRNQIGQKIVQQQILFLGNDNDEDQNIHSLGLYLLGGIHKTIFKYNEQQKEVKTEEIVNKCVKTSCKAQNIENESNMKDRINKTVDYYLNQDKQNIFLKQSKQMLTIENADLLQILKQLIQVYGVAVIDYEVYQKNMQLFNLMEIDLLIIKSLEQGSTNVAIQEII